MVRPDTPKDDDQTSPGPIAVKRVTVQEAADALGITVEAVRARIKRGKLRREKGESGTVYVWLEADQTQPDIDQMYDRIRPDSDQTTTRTDDEAQAALIGSLKDQLAYMREQLAEEREARRRADTIIAQLTHANATLAQRVPELEPTTEPRETPERAPQQTGRGTAPEEQEKTSGESQERKRSWWRGFFGLD
jgi:predicted ArsR family transcriptional regulator